MKPAQRLEGRNKASGFWLLSDGTSWHAAGSPRHLTQLYTIRVKGRDAPVEIFTDPSTGTQ